MQAWLVTPKDITNLEEDLLNYFETAYWKIL